MQKNFNTLVNIVARLRGKKGCSWDRAQTLNSIRENIIEEAYETVEAINTKDYHELKKEAGDLLLQTVFISQMTKEKNIFDINEVIKEVIDKLIRRHPHVFQNLKIKNQKELLHNWEHIKEKEKSKEQGENIFSHVPKILPALLKAKKVQSKAGRLGLYQTENRKSLSQIQKQIYELKRQIKNRNKQRASETVGDILFTLTDIARLHHLDPELSLNKKIEQFMKEYSTKK